MRKIIVLEGSMKILNIRVFTVHYDMECLTHTHTTIFPGPPGWAGARRELLDFIFNVC